MLNLNCIDVSLCVVPFANAALSSGIPGVLKEILLMKDPVLCSQCFRATLTLAKTGMFSCQPYCDGYVDL